MTITTTPNRGRFRPGNNFSNGRPALNNLIRILRDTSNFESGHVLCDSLLTAIMNRDAETLKRFGISPAQIKVNEQLLAAGHLHFKVKGSNNG
ncbi:hypothetical protein [Erwinia sp.]|uniref:hypothetical protein n=1 Tax=Erwinia citreus TaxID=558 RepID=UPI003C7462F1